MGNPKKIVDAFVPVGNKLGEFTPGRMLVLERIKHPLVQPAKKGGIKMSDEEVLTGMFVLATPMRDLYFLLESGLPEFKASVWEYADTIALKDVPEYGQQMNAALDRAMSTLISQGSTSGGSESNPGERKPRKSSSPRKKDAATD